jgi:signal transduction histidine kinase
MRERLAAVGGRLERDGDGGTRLTARLPPPAADEASAATPAAGALFAEAVPEAGA